jgi:hypothetical protein
MQRAGAAKAIGSPAPSFNCPSRRNVATWPLKRSLYNSDDPASKQVGRTDFASNAGDGDCEGPSPEGAGPGLGQMGTIDQFNWWWKGQGFASPDAKYTGVCYARSNLKLSAISDGLSKTYLLGERYLDPASLTTGLDEGDNENYLAGFNNDSSRSTRNAPARDKAGMAYSDRFGSSHPGGFSMVFVDGSIRHVEFEIDPTVHRVAGNRSDGQ